MAGENAAKRRRLFDLYVRQPGHEDVTQGRFFWCPLCRRPFDRVAATGDNPRLTLAHIIQQSLGGTWTTLTCADCNNAHGHKIEVDLLSSHRLADWVAGRGTIEVRMGDGGRVRAISRRNPEANHLSFDVKTPMASAAARAHQERLAAIAQSPSGGHEVKLTLPWFRPSRCRAAVYQSAYLLMFSYFGYDFVRNPRYNSIRDEIFRTDGSDRVGHIIVLPPPIAEQFLEGNQAAVVFVRQPMRAILATLRFRSPGGIDQVLAVAMPGPDEPELTAVNLTDAIYSPVTHDPDHMSTQQGSFWLTWRGFVRGFGSQSYHRPNRGRSFARSESPDCARSRRVQRGGTRKPFQRFGSAFWSCSRAGGSRG